MPLLFKNFRKGYDSTTGANFSTANTFSYYRRKRYLPLVLQVFWNWEDVDPASEVSHHLSLGQRVTCSAAPAGRPFGRPPRQVPRGWSASAESLDPAVDQQEPTASEICPLKMSAIGERAGATTRPVGLGRRAYSP